MNWFKKLIKKEYWEYTCENGHIWREKDSPKSLFMFGNKCTHCPVCYSTICKGDNYVDGKCIGGSIQIHNDFIIKKEVKNARSNNKKSKSNIRRR